jgi:hypothetical protein
MLPLDRTNTINTINNSEKGSNAALSPGLSGVKPTSKVLLSGPGSMKLEPVDSRFVKNVPLVVTSKNRINSDLTYEGNISFRPKELQAPESMQSI